MGTLSLRTVVYPFRETSPSSLCDRRAGLAKCFLLLVRLGDLGGEGVIAESIDVDSLLRDAAFYRQFHDLFQPLLVIIQIRIVDRRQNCSLRYRRWRADKHQRDDPNRRNPQWPHGTPLSS